MAIVGWIMAGWFFDDDSSTGSTRANSGGVARVAQKDAVDARDSAELRAIANGDLAAFEHAYRNYSPALFNFVIALTGEAAVAEDVVQETFLRIWTARASLRTTGSFRAYCFAVARNVVRHQQRHARVVQNAVRRVDLSTDVSVAGVGGHRESIDIQLVHDEEQTHITRAIAALPARMREIFLLRWYGRLSYAEIAQTLGIATKAVDNQLSRAVRLVRDAVSKASENGSSNE